MTPELKAIVMHMSSLTQAQRSKAFVSILAAWDLPDAPDTPYERALTAAAWHWTHSDPTTVAAAHECVEYITEKLAELGIEDDRFALDLRDLQRFLPASEGYDPDAIRIAVELMGCQRRGDTTVYSTNDHSAVTRLAPVPAPRGRRRSDSIHRAS